MAYWKVWEWKQAWGWEKTSVLGRRNKMPHSKVWVPSSSRKTKQALVILLVWENSQVTGPTPASPRAINSWKMYWNLGGSSLVTLKGQLGGVRDAPTIFHVAHLTAEKEHLRRSPGASEWVRDSCLCVVHPCPAQTPLNQEATPFASLGLR